MFRFFRVATAMAASLVLAATSISPASAADVIPGVGRSTIPVKTAAELERALAIVQPGQTIKLKAGVYVGNFATTRAGRADLPITLRGPKDAILINSGADGAFTGPCRVPQPGYNSGYGLWLSSAPHWMLQGFTITDSKKGLVIDSSAHVTVDGVTVTRLEDEGIHFRATSPNGVVKNSTVSHTGLVQQAFGEGIYIGTGEEQLAGQGHWGVLSGQFQRHGRVEWRADHQQPHRPICVG